MQDTNSLLYIIIPCLHYISSTICIMLYNKNGSKFTLGLAGFFMCGVAIPVLTHILHLSTQKPKESIYAACCIVTVVTCFMALTIPPWYVFSTGMFIYSCIFSLFAISLVRIDRNPRRITPSTSTVYKFRTLYTNLDECPICFETLYPDTDCHVYHSRFTSSHYHHFTCSSCAINIRRCPMCGVDAILLASN